MKKLFLIAAILAAFPFLAQAETLQFPSDKPIAEITIPDSWEPKETDTGIDATSSDAAIYFSIDIANVSTIDQTVSDAIDFLRRNGVTIDAASKQDFPDTEVNGMKMGNLAWSGTDEDGPVHVQLGFVQPTEKQMLVITYWGSSGDEDKHSDAVIAIIKSLKQIKD